MASNTIRLGFVGCGGITSAHLNGLRILRENGMDRFEVAALCSRHRENAERYLKRGEGPPPLPPISPYPQDPLNIREVTVSDLQGALPRIYVDHREMLKDRAVDAIVILSAVSAHYPVASDALESGVHVCIEKPFTVTVRAALRLIEKAEEKGLSLGVAENLRYGEGTRAAGWLLKSHVLGDVQMVISGGVGSVWSPDLIVGKTAWRHLKRDAGGGGTMDIGAHLFDQIRYLCGEIEEISALTRTIEPRRFLRDDAGRVVEQVDCEVEDTFFALLTFQSGAIGNIMSSWAGHGEPTELQSGMAVYGERGCMKGERLILDGKDPLDIVPLFREKADSDVLERFFPSDVKDSFALELYEFLASIEEGRPPETSGVEGLKDIAPGLAILESSALGKSVKLADVESCRIESCQREINAYFGIE